jgi:hypothetical protein
MSENTFSCMYVLLVKQASLTTLLAPMVVNGLKDIKLFCMSHTCILFYIIVGGEHTVGTTLTWKTKWVV